MSQQYFSLSITVEIFAVVLALGISRDVAVFFGIVGLVLGIVGFIFPPRDEDLKRKDKAE
jgi:hypothetical protein